MMDEPGYRKTPQSHYALIGEVTHLWSMLEFNIDLALWHLMDVEQQLGACVTAQFHSIHPRSKALIALLQLRRANEQSVKDVQRFMGTLNGLSEKRNRVVHDARFVDHLGQTYRCEITAKPKVKFGPVVETEEELQNLINDISNKIRAFQKLRDRVLTEVDNLPPESHPILLELTLETGSEQGSTNDEQ